MRLLAAVAVAVAGAAFLSRHSPVMPGTADSPAVAAAAVAAAAAAAAGYSFLETAFVGNAWCGCLLLLLLLLPLFL